MKGITFGSYHSYDDLQLILNSKEIGCPEVKVNEIDIEGADGSLDLTEFFGEPKYENVKHKFQFSTIVPQAQFLSAFSKVKNALHGKKSGSSLTMIRFFTTWGGCTFRSSPMTSVLEWSAWKRTVSRTS